MDWDLLFLLAILAIAVLAGRRLPARWRHWHRQRHRAALEDVLKHLITQKIEGREASLDSLAGHLGVQKGMMTRLLVELESGGQVRSEGPLLHLTDEGERSALRVLRAHRLWETYLANEARMPVAKLHKPAEQAEHRLTARQLDELDASLGHPRRDPHGDPIPSASGEITPLEAQPLSAWPAGLPAEIAHVEDEPESVFRRISECGLRVGSRLLVEQHSPEQVTIRAGDRRYDLPPVVAGSIQVIPAAPAADRTSLVPLSQLGTGERGQVVLLDDELRGFTRRRLLDLGLTPNAVVTAHLANAFGDPFAYRVRNTTVALRREQAGHVWVRKLEAVQ